MFLTPVSSRFCLLVPDKSLFFIKVFFFYSTSWRSAEQSPSGSRGVVLGHVSRVVYGDPSDGRDIPAPGGLTSRWHFSSQHWVDCLFFFCATNVSDGVQDAIKLQDEHLVPPRGLSTSKTTQGLPSKQHVEQRAVIGWKQGASRQVEVVVFCPWSGGCSLKHRI